MKDFTPRGQGWADEMCLQRMARAPAVARNDSSRSPFQENLRRGRPSESFRPRTYPARSGNDTLGSTQAIAKSASLLTLPQDRASLRVDPESPPSWVTAVVIWIA